MVIVASWIDLTPRQEGLHWVLFGWAVPFQQYYCQEILMSHMNHIKSFGEIFDQDYRSKPMKEKKKNCVKFLYKKNSFGNKKIKKLLTGKNMGNF